MIPVIGGCLLIGLACLIQHLPRPLRRLSELSLCKSLVPGANDFFHQQMECLSQTIGACQCSLKRDAADTRAAKSFIEQILLRPNRDQAGGSVVTSQPCLVALLKN